MRRRAPRVAALICVTVFAFAFAFAQPAKGAAVALDGTIRDFHGSFTSTSPFTPETNGHPHFEIFTVDPNNPLGPSRIPAGYGGLLGLQSQIGVVEPDIVGTTLGADQKPVWVGGSNANLFPTTKTKVNATNDNLELNSDNTANAANFNQWFNDTPDINSSKAFQLVLNDPENDGVFTYQNDSFFPIDNQLFGNEGRAHNQHFTYEAHSTFTFKAGQSFTFTGDDDVWVFINNQRVIDLGGVHQSLSGTVDLNTLGLTDGNTYNFDFFFAERNTFQSHFRIDTSIALGDDVPEPPQPPTGIPLPAAAYPGLILLGAMGGVARLRKFRRAHH